MRRSAPVLAGLFGLLAIAAAPAAGAKTFYVVQSSPDTWTVMDPDGVEAVPGTSVQKAWAVRVQKDLIQGPPPEPGYVRTLTEYDCDKERTRWREFSAFSRAGKLLASKVNPQPEWGPATEQPDVYAAFRVVCRSGGDGSVISADTLARVVIGLMGSWDSPGAAATPPPAPVKPAPATPAARGPAKPR